MNDLAVKYWLAFLVCYLFTIAVETPVLLMGLSARHPTSRRLFAGAWLTACTYPIVFIVLPESGLFDLQPTESAPLGPGRFAYLLVAEIFAPVAECILFWIAFGDSSASRGSFLRDMTAVVLANLASFGLGELLIRYDWLPAVASIPSL